MGGVSLSVSAPRYVGVHVHLCSWVCVSVCALVLVLPCPCAPVFEGAGASGGVAVGLMGLSLPTAGRAPGDLLIRSLSEVHAGIYQCRVTNRVGYSVCQINLSLAPSKCHHRGDTARAGCCRGLALSARVPPGAW